MTLERAWTSTIGYNSQGQKGVFPNNYVTNHSFISMGLFTDFADFVDRLRLYDNGSALFYELRRI